MTRKEAIRIVRLFTKDLPDSKERLLARTLIDTIPESYGLTYHNMRAAMRTVYGVDVHPSSDGAYFPGVGLRPQGEIDIILEATGDLKPRPKRKQAKPNVILELPRLITPDPNASLPVESLFKAFYRKVSNKRLQAAMLELFEVSPVKAPRGTQDYQWVYPGYSLVATSLDARSALDLDIDFGPDDD